MVLAALASSKDPFQEVGSGKKTFSFSKKAAEPFFMYTKDDAPEEDEEVDQPPGGF
jgi:hypothetical protein